MTERIKHGEKYPKVDELPDGAMMLSIYAKQMGYKQAAYVCVKFDRYKKGETPNSPGYKIVNWQGFNFVIPD